ncbi:acyl-CoA dehydrogenase family protein [Sphingomonas qomolangmaensis]|uniref:Acyl-CoA/acyl-ACP dehydrogenase n=1 Tax=Sphingomonas qomolangmaensis TaxID=2918765 RepID=A0ABY5L8C6_9SPHN|nr:acyl-CoA dehydrogenase family protein [Sphingomonas qomolangmaensis]UUL82313.1 acyl-CoA/acyl-ACP dehydrogenase [Sphingomonas qomolangmaensis]
MNAAFLDADARSGGSTSGARFDDELTAATDALAIALRERDLAIFYRAFRATQLPFLCGPMRDDVDALFPACFAVVHRLGGLSPALALAVENHYYVTSAVATFPAAADPALEVFRHRLLDRVTDARLLVANTNSKIHGTRLGEIGTAAHRHGDGFRISGKAAYTSLATEADLLVLLTEIADEGTALFVLDRLRDNPAVVIGDYLLPTAMIDSDTRHIGFDDLDLPKEALATAAGSPLTALLIRFEMAWHQALIGALYLGCAARALDEIRRFAGEMRGRDGVPLAKLDGMIVDTGRLAIDYATARAAVERCGAAIARVRALPRDSEAIERASNEASVAKYSACRVAEAIVTAARRIVGARSFAGNSVLERLSSEVMFGVLGPEVGAVTERRLGKQVLEGSFFARTFG